MLTQKTKKILPLVISIVVITLLFVILSGQYINKVADVLTSDANAKLFEATQQGERHINYSIQTDITGLQMLSNTLVGRGENVQTDVTQSLKLLLKGSDFRNVAATGLNGFGITAEGKVINFSQNPAFLTALKGTVSVSFVKEMDTNSHRIAYDVPIVMDGKIVGVISAMKDVSVFAEILDISTANEATAYVLDNTGAFVAIATKSEIPRDTQNVFEFFEHPKNSPETVKAFKNGLSSKMPYIGTIHSRGEQKLFAFTPISGVNNWVYMTVVPQASVHKQMQAVLRLSFFMIGFVLIGLATIFILAITTKNKHTKEILNLAHIDQLTGIANWNKFKIDCDEIMRKPSKQRRAIISIDIDSFKIFNDLYGHQEGNKVLKGIASLLEKSILLGERCSRHSADTFYALIKYETEQNISDWILSFKNTVYRELGNYPITLSFGIYEIGDIAHPLDIMCDRASLARLTIKGDHEQPYAFYDDETRKHIVEIKEIENEMHCALDNNQFHVYFQPKHSFKNSSIVGAEALARWFHPIKGVVFPDVFIPVFEHNGFIVHLDMYVLEQTCKTIHNWIENGITPINISVNMSQIHLRDPRFIEKLVDIIRKYDVPAHYIEIELTESAIFENVEAFTKIVQLLKKYGFTVSMDDFGSGYSSLNLLSEIQVDILKIDRLFLGKSSDTIRGKFIIESVINMAKNLGITTVSEGVETKEQVEFLKEAGCDIAQGYFFSRPLAPDTFENYIKDCESHPKDPPITS